MMGGRAVGLERGQVRRCAIAFMLIEAVGRILLVELEHQVIARHFRDDRSSRDREAARALRITTEEVHRAGSGTRSR